MPKKLKDGATTPRRDALWVRGSHHQMVKICTGLLGYSNLYQFVEEAIRAHVERTGLLKVSPALARLFESVSEQSEGDGDGEGENVS